MNPAPSHGAAVREETAAGCSGSRVYWGAVAFLFAAAIWERSRLPATPFSDPDTWGYLYPSLSAFTRGVFVHTYGRTFVYPLFVYGILNLTHDFVWVTLVQHALGLLTGVFLLAAWRAFSPFLPNDPALRQWHKYLGLLPLGIFLLSKTSLLMEHSIRPEAVFPFFAVLCIYLAIRHFQSKFPAAAFCWGAALVYTAILLYFIKPAWGFGVLFALLPLISKQIHNIQFKRHLFHALLIFLVPILLASVTLAVPERRLIDKYDPKADRFLPSLLLSVHADMIRDEMARDLADNSAPPNERPLLSAIIPMIDAEIKANAPNSRKLAVNPDVFLYRKGNVCDLVDQFFGKDTPAYRAFCFSYYEKAWLHQPWKMARKVLRQLYAFYSWENQGYDASIHSAITDKETAIRTRDALQNLPVPLPSYDTYRAASAVFEKSPARWRQPIPVSILSMLLYVLYPLAVLATLAACLLLWARRRDPRLAVLIPLSLWTLYFYSYNFGNCLTIAVVHNMQIGRYVKNQLAYTVFSECCGLLFIAAAARAFASKPDIPRPAKAADPRHAVEHTP